MPTPLQLLLGIFSPPDQPFPLRREQGAACSSPDVLDWAAPHCPPAGRQLPVGERSPQGRERSPLSHRHCRRSTLPSPPTSPPTVGSIEPPTASSAPLAGRALYMPQTKRETDPPIEKGAIPPEFGKTIPSAVFSPPKTQNQPPIGDPPLFSPIERLPSPHLSSPISTISRCKRQRPVARGVGRQAAVLASFIETYFSGGRTMPGHPHLIRAS